LKSDEDFKTFLNKVFFIENRAAAFPVDKLALITPIRAHDRLYYKSNQQRDRMNGWKNYETWNVSLWIQNDETFYKLALMSAGFQSFMNQVHAWGCDKTEDGVKWVDADYSEVQSMFNEMKVTTDFHHWKSALVHF
jgi:hypothetical protein